MATPTCSPITRPPPPALAPLRGAGRRHSVLVVDDDAFMRVVMGDLLRAQGFREVHEAASGSAALVALKRLSPAPELVICDLNMPGGDGFEFMQQLGSEGYAGAVLLVSGMDARTLNSASLMARFHRLNILATLPKPMNAAALGSALAKLA